MLSNSKTALIRDQSPEEIAETDNSLKNNNNGNLLNIQSIALEKLLDDPDMQEVVVMEVFFFQFE